MAEGGGKRVVARLALFAALVLAVGVVFALVEVEVSLRWRGGAAGVSGGGGGGGSSVSLSTNKIGDGPIKNKVSGVGRDGDSNALISEEVDLEPPDAPWTGGGQRAYVVVFPDVQDPLVLERALGLWGSLEGLKGDGEDVVAIVPRFFGQQLLAPLVDMGYRVLPRETPAPPWRANGRFVQQTLTAIGPGWGSSGGGGHGWSLLALEALALTEYEEVVVLDQKVVVFPPLDQAQQNPRRTQGSGDRRATAQAADPSPEGKEEAEEDGGRWDSKQGKGRRRLLGGDGGSNRGGREETEIGETQQRITVAAGADGSTLPRLAPQGGGWTVAFAEGAESALAQGPGLRSLPEGQQEHFGGQHPAVMAVRPDADLYKRISQLLCKGDTVLSETFPGMPATNHVQALARDQVWERRAPTVPLLHLAVGMTSSSDAVTAKLPLAVCGGGNEFDSEDAGGGEGEGGVLWRWTGAASPVVWCPASSSHGQESEQQQRRQQRRQRRRRLGDRAAENVAGRPTSAEAERTADSVLTARGSGDGGGDIFGGGAERTGFEPDRGCEVREGHRLVREIIQGGGSPADADVAAATVTLGGRRDDQQLRRRPGLEPGRTGCGSTRSLRVDRTGVVVDKGDGFPEMIESGLAGQQEGEGQEQGVGGEKGVEGDEGGENSEGEEEGGEGEGDQRHENPGEGGPPTEKQQEEREDGEGKMEARAGAMRLAWIPGDPCSCADAPGMVGEACRSWLMARARANFSRTRGGQSSDAESIDRQGAEKDLVVLALSACENGVLASPMQPPKLPAQQAARAAATAGASHLARLSSPGSGGGVDGAEGGGSAGVPPPLWQESKPRNRPVVTPEDMKAFQHFWVANVEKKLLMVAIPKVACTQVHALFLRMQGSANWNSPHMHEIHYHKDMGKYKVKTMPNMTPERVSSILTDPTWTKAVFLRDPAERLLSCFLDKIVHRKSYSVSIFQAEEILSFERFVSLTSKEAQAKYQEQYPGGNLGLSRRSNPHWRPQLYFGLDKFLPYFNFIGDFKHVGAHSEALLRRAGLWDEFGASGWGPGGNSAFFQRSTVQGHATGSHDSKSQYYTPPLLASVREAYAPTDYKLLAGIGWWNDTTQG